MVQIYGWCNVNYVLLAKLFALVVLVLHFTVIAYQMNIPMHFASPRLRRQRLLSFVDHYRRGEARQRLFALPILQ